MTYLEWHAIRILCKTDFIKNNYGYELLEILSLLEFGTLAESANNTLWR